MARILVTGSEGLVGSALGPRLGAEGHSVRRFDRRHAAHEDVRDLRALEEALRGVDGVVHLAAVSRVIDGERDPSLCRDVNLGGMANVLDAAARAEGRPFVLFASSREVYGDPGALPVDETAPPRPRNVYGETKVEGEERVRRARRRGLRTAIVRLSNVFGSIDDHVDRVIPAFVRAGLEGRPLRVDGLESTFDFTHVDDVARGLGLVVERLLAGERELPELHFVTGRATTLGELAERARALGGGRSEIRVAPPRDFDVARFVGDPARAERVLGFRTEVSLERGLARLAEAFRAAADGARASERRPPEAHGFRTEVP